MAVPVLARSDLLLTWPVLWKVQSISLGDIHGVRKARTVGPWLPRLRFHRMLWEGRGPRQRLVSGLEPPQPASAKAMLQGPVRVGPLPDTRAIELPLCDASLGESCRHEAQAERAAGWTEPNKAIGVPVPGFRT